MSGVNNKMDKVNKRPSRQSDLSEITRLLEERVPLREILDSYPATYIRCRSKIIAIRAAMIPPRTAAPQIHIRWGPTGSGKTRYVWDNFPHEDIYSGPYGKCWGYYNGEKVVIIDNVEPSTYGGIDWETWLGITDRCPYQVPFKGGRCEFNSEMIFITSNSNPETWFPRQANRAAFFERVTTCKYVGYETEAPTCETLQHPMLEIPNVGER